MLGAFRKAGINEFEISIKFCGFLIPILIFFKKKFFWVIIALFRFLKCKCEKNCTFSNILLKVKSYFFANIYHSPSDSYWNSKKSLKLKPPTADSLNSTFQAAPSCFLAASNSSLRILKSYMTSRRCYASTVYLPYCPSLHFHTMQQLRDG